MGLLLRTAADARYRCPADELSGCGAGLLDVETLLTLTQLQKRCGCQGEKYCVDGMCLDCLLYTSRRDPRLASVYDAEIAPVWTQPFGKLLLGQVAPLDGKATLLDVMCHTGYPGFELLRRFPEARLMACLLYTSRCV